MTEKRRRGLLERATTLWTTDAISSKYISATVDPTPVTETGTQVPGDDGGPVGSGWFIKKRTSEVKVTVPRLTRSRSQKLYSNNQHFETRKARALSAVHGQRPNFLMEEGVSSASDEPELLSNYVLSDTESTPSSPVASFNVPVLLRQGIPMVKVSAKRHRRHIFRLDQDEGQILWESKKLKMVPIENIKEIRTGADTRYYREQFQLSQDYEDRWCSIIYVLDGQYKTLHLIAATRDVLNIWESTLGRLFADRQELMNGLGHSHVREAMWEKQYWKGSKRQEDGKLSLEDVERLCKRLSVNPSSEHLRRLFQQADAENRGYLDFPQFQKFVKLLKARPEIERLYTSICNANNGTFDLTAFETFMRKTQKSSASASKFETIFSRYASPCSEFNSASLMQAVNQQAYATSSDYNINITDCVSSQSPSPSSSSWPSTSLSSSDLLTSSTSSSSAGPNSMSRLPSSSDSSSLSPSEDMTWSLEGFTSFLLSTDNSPSADQHGEVTHDMTRPLAEYYISSSHNTYLVGSQVIGVSTIEGYIRALLHGCRSVELDIYDGESEPVVFHGKTLTSKIPVREVCQAIAKYAFVTSPYPIIISAEIHCGLVQQDILAQIMQQEFREALVTRTIDGKQEIDVLPSPENLKGRILLKAKNLYVSSSHSLQEKEVTVNAESSSTETSESDILTESKHNWHGMHASEAIRELKDDLEKARTAVDRTIDRHHGHGTGISSKFASSMSAALLKPAPEKSSHPAKVKMSFALAALLVYTVGVKCRGLNKKEHYAPVHMFSLSENTANKMMKQGMVDLVKHTRTHLVRLYPKGLRLSSTNYEPHKYWSIGSQLVAMNFQTYDLGCMINHAMFQRNGRSGYVLKPLALRTTDKDMLSKHTHHFLDITVISAQQLSKPKDSRGHEVMEKTPVEPFVEVSIHIPEWATPSSPKAPPRLGSDSSSSSHLLTSATLPRTVVQRTVCVRNNGFNPIWNEELSLPFDCVGSMQDLIFVRFVVKQEGKGDEDEPLAAYCISLGSLNQGFRHLPLHDTQFSQYLFSTLFVQINIRDVQS